MEHFLLVAIKFAAFVFVCGSLMRFRFQNKTTGLIAAGVLAGILALQAGLLAAGLDETLVLTLLPVTAYVPAILAVHVLSGSNFFADRFRVERRCPGELPAAVPPKAAEYLADP